MKGCDNGKMKEMIRLQGISKKFGDHIIIPSIDLTIYDGEFITLLGPSGCGKTTLLRMIAGLEQPTEGKIYLDDEDVTKLPPYKRDVNMVFQNYALFPHMTVEENIHFGLKMKNVPMDEQKERVNQVLYLTQLEELRKRRPQQMSGGQQQRVAIARALVNNPKVLLLDEPLGALDYQLRKNLQLELKNLQRGLGLTFIYVTHDQEEALTMSDRIVVMNKGVIEQDDNPDTIYHTPKTKFVAKFIGESNFFEHEDGSTSVVRPEKLNLCPEDEENANHPEPQLYGTVVDVVFYGTIDKVFVRLDNSNQTVVAYQYFDDVKRWQPDERVGIWWQPQDEVIVHK
jgi:spermidine/putrescine transport system ATP-binding protein